MRIIKFTTCLAVNALNTLVLHLSFSLSPRCLPMIYLESCITKFPQFGDMCHCDCQRNMPIPPSYTLMFPTSHPILWALYLYPLFLKTANPEFISPFNLSKTAILSWHFLFLKSINNGKDDENSNNTAAAGANIWGLNLGQVLYLALHILSYLSLKQTQDVNNYFNSSTDDRIKPVLQGILVKDLYL